MLLMHLVTILIFSIQLVSIGNERLSIVNIFDWKGSISDIRNQ